MAILISLCLSSHNIYIFLKLHIVYLKHIQFFVKNNPTKSVKSVSCRQKQAKKKKKEKNTLKNE